MWENNGSSYVELVMLLERYRVLSSQFLFLFPAEHQTDLYSSEWPYLSFSFTVSEQRGDERLQYMPRQCHYPFWSWLCAYKSSAASCELGQKMQAVPSSWF